MFAPLLVATTGRRQRHDGRAPSRDITTQHGGKQLLQPREKQAFVDFVLQANHNEFSVRFKDLLDYSHPRAFAGHWRTAGRSAGKAQVSRSASKSVRTLEGQAFS